MVRQAYDSLRAPRLGQRTEISPCPRGLRNFCNEMGWPAAAQASTGDFRQIHDLATSMRLGHACGLGRDSTGGLSAHGLRPS